MKLLHDRIARYLGLATFTWTMLFVWQGLDFTDMGFWLTGYQQFYTHPETGWSLCWLTNFIGHWTGVALGGKVVSYRIGYAVVVTVSAMIGYCLLASQLGQSRLLAATLFLTVCLARSCQTNWVGYNELTALFYLIAAVQLYFGLIGKRRTLLIFAGITLGANVFIRLPNILGVSLVVTILLYAWICRWTFRKVLGMSSLFLGGFILGVAFIIGMIFLHGHAVLVFQSIQAIVGEANTCNTPHASSGLLRRLVFDHIWALIEGTFIIVFAGFSSNWLSKQKTFQISVFGFVATLVLSFVFYVLGHWQWVIPGFCYITLSIIVAAEWKTKPPLALLAFVAGLILFLVPLGSTNGLTNSVFGMWLALPLALIWLGRGTDKALQLQCAACLGNMKLNGQWAMSAQGSRLLATVIALALLVQSLAAAWRYTFRDCGNRARMTQSIKHPLLIGTYTTAERAVVVTELLGAMARYTKPGDAVIAYNGIPTIFYLTQTYPWNGFSWPDFGGSEMNSDSIWRKERTGASLPCVVRAKGSTYVNSWPEPVTPLSTFWRQDETRSVFAEFEKRHGYAVAWSNAFFEILTPSNEFMTSDQATSP